MASSTDKISAAANVRTLPSATPVTLKCAGMPLPFTAWLNSAAGGRLIRYSVDNGTNWHNASYDVSIASQVVVTIQGSITDLEFTGTTNDTYGVF